MFIGKRAINAHCNISYHRRNKCSVCISLWILLKMLIISFCIYRNKNEIICHLIETANIIISYTDIKSVMPMCTMLTILLKQIGVSPTYMAIQPNLSEELKLNIINCFEMIFRQALPEVVIKFYNRENLNLLAQVLSISEYILANETYKLLRYNDLFL